MSEFFNSPSNRRVREETRARVEYADRDIEDLGGLMSQVRVLFSDRISRTEGEMSVDDSERLFKECIKEVSGAEEVFEIWDVLFDENEPNK